VTTPPTPEKPVEERIAMVLGDKYTNRDPDVLALLLEDAQTELQRLRAENDLLSDALAARGRTARNRTARNRTDMTVGMLRAQLAEAVEIGIRLSWLGDHEDGCESYLEDECTCGIPGAVARLSALAKESGVG